MQVKYVVEFAKVLEKMPEVYRVDLLTRQIYCPEVDSSYAKPTEMLNSDHDEEIHESGGAYIVRIPCVCKKKYIEKELLWPYIPEFVDGALGHILNISKALGDMIGEGRSVWPHVIHGHYADVGDATCLLLGALNVPMVVRGHSRGRNKLEQILKQGLHSKEDINATYNIMRRIEAEELCIDSAKIMVTSTRKEIEEQWGMYDGFNLELNKNLKHRASGEPLVTKLAIIIQEIMNAVRSASNFPSPGFILSTTLTISETLFVLQSIGVKLSAFDALICSGGRQLLHIAGDSLDSHIYLDRDYDSHIDYRWGAEGLRKKHEKTERSTEFSILNGGCRSI